MEKLNYKKMVKEINVLVDNDFCFDMDCHNLPNSKPITQKEAREMVRILGKIYLISHCLHCKACQGKYLTNNGIKCWWIFFHNWKVISHDNLLDKVQECQKCGKVRIIYG